MITVNTQGITVNTNLIKAVTLGTPGNIALDKLNRTVKVGTLSFPLLPLNKLIFDSRNLLFTYEDKLCVLVDGYAHTLETVELEILPNDSVIPYVPPLDGDGNPIWEQTTYPGISQIALVSVTYGNDTRNLITGGSSQKIRMVYVKDAPIVVVATNITTGAVSTTSITPGSGQRYSVKVNSTTEQVGERIEFCVQEELDISNAPPKLLGYAPNQSISKTSYLTVNTHRYTPSNFYYNAPQDQSLVEARKQFANVVNIYSNPVPQSQSVIDVILSQKYKLEFSYLSFPDALNQVERPDLAADDPTLNFIVSGKPFQVPSNQVLTNNSYTLSFSGLTLPPFNLRHTMDTYGPASDVIVELVPGAWYMLQTLVGSYNFTNDYITTAQPNNYDGNWLYTVNAFTTLITEVFLYGPIEKVCSKTQVTDTRDYKYASYITIGSLN